MGRGTGPRDVFHGLLRARSVLRVVGFLGRGGDLIVVGLGLGGPLGRHLRRDVGQRRHSERAGGDRGNLDREVNLNLAVEPNHG